MPFPVYYHDYLQLDKILGAQALESDVANTHAHDEMLFIVIHQAYELWFKQILFEVDSVRNIFSKEKINDNSNELQTAVHRLGRTVEILKVLVQQIDILETMTPMDFLEFRDLLRPASGFQSIQFKILEAKLGLKYEDRFALEYYLSQLKPEHVSLIKDVEKEASILEMLDGWLSRMPFFDDTKYWKDLPANDKSNSVPKFWVMYRELYSKSLDQRESKNIEVFDSIFIDGSTKMKLSSTALRSALFIMLYRGNPMLHLPFSLLSTLLDIDEQLATWRFRHINMVHRTIGSRIGTGGSTGKDYLEGALNKHYIFKDLAALTSFIISGKNIPQLPDSLINDLGFK
jgi:tryptophan 2,3-dioxygenase